MKKTKNLFRKMFLVGTAMSLTASINYEVAKRTEFFDLEPLKVETYENGQGRILEIPRFNPVKLGYLNCARYARMVSEKVFSLKYTPANTWNFSYANQPIVKVEESNLELLAQNGTLEPGMILGTYNPKSRYANRTDQTGRPVKYTHTVVYLGEGRNGQPIFVHQFGAKIRIDTLSSLKEQELELREVIAPRGYVKNSVNLDCTD
jgi:hypothetical protein